MAGSEAFVHIPIHYGDFSYAQFGSPQYRVFVEYGAKVAEHLLFMHLRLVMYAKAWHLSTLDDVLVCSVMRPAPVRTVRRDAARLAEVGFLEVTDGGYFIPAAVEWTQSRVGTRDLIPDRTRQRVYERDGYRCTECGTGENLTLDHVIPWSKNGPDTEGNLRTLCASCNSAKGTRTESRRSRKAVPS